MIVINGEQYAENDKEFIDSLFTPGGTLRTFAKIQKRKSAKMRLYSTRARAADILNAQMAYSGNFPH